MKPLLRRTLSMLLALAPIAAALPEKEDFHLFILAGQSNMAGRAKLEKSAAEPIKGILAMNKELEWQPATDPLHWDKPSAAGGMGRPFAEAVLKKTKGVEIGLIPTAVGGSSVHAWTPDAKANGTNLYNNAMNCAKAAMKKGTLKAILWHQGEADSKEGAIELHEERMTELIKNFRKDLRSPDLPFLIGQLGHSKDEATNELRKGIDDANRKVAEKLENVVFVSSEGLTTADSTHFDAPSIRTFGERYAAAYLKLIEGK